jgi:hypothetical protein
MTATSSGDSLESGFRISTPVLLHARVDPLPGQKCSGNLRVVPAPIRQAVDKTTIPEGCGRIRGQIPVADRPRQCRIQKDAVRSSCKTRAQCIRGCSACRISDSPLPGVNDRCLRWEGGGLPERQSADRILRGTAARSSENSDQIARWATMKKKIRDGAYGAPSEDFCRKWS